MSGEEYLTECGWRPVEGGWEHPSEPGVVRTVAEALIEQGGRQRPARIWGGSAYRGSSRPAPDQWEGSFEDR